jgi:hypothetical protein
MRVLIALSVALAGCASPPYWVKQHEPMTALPIITVSASPWGPSIRGWVIRDPKTKTCQPIIVQGACEAVVAHELKHCAGYDHPDYRIAFTCPGDGGGL